MYDVKLAYQLTNFSKEEGKNWNEVCRDIVERFGLPGQRYTTNVSEHALIFSFHDAEDALVAELMLDSRGRNWHKN